MVYTISFMCWFSAKYINLKMSDYFHFAFDSRLFLQEINISVQTKMFEIVGIFK